MRKLWKWILLFALITALSCGIASAETSGTCGADGDNLTWTLDDNGLLTVSGTGAMGDYGYTDMPWFAYQSSVKSVVLNNGVTSIGENAFMDCRQMTSISIPDSVTSIGMAALNGTGLTSVLIPAGVSTIGERALSVNYSLSEILVADGNTSFASVDGVLFSYDKTRLVAYPGAKAGDYTVPDGVSLICRSAFSWNKKLTAVTLPASVQSIERQAFQQCSALAGIVIPRSVTAIPDYAFSGCTALADIYFTGTESEWNAVTVGSNNTPLNSAAVHYDYDPAIPSNPCGDNVSWTLDDEGTLTISGTGAMYDYAVPGNAPPWRWTANEIGYIVVEDGVTHIGSYAFWFCNIVDVVEIPASVTSIGQSAFANCHSMMEVDYSGSRSGWNEISIAETGNEYLLAADIVCAVPDEGRISASFDAASGCLNVSGTGAMPQYQISWEPVFCAIDAPWYEYRGNIRSIVIESGVTSISEGAFSGCSHLTEISIPDSVTEIGSYAFYECSSLSGINIPAGVTSIRQETFYGCSGLNSVVFPDNLLLIGNSAFMNCSGLTGIELPSALTAVRNQAFFGCTGLAGITLPANLKAIGDLAFSDCGLTEIRTEGSTLTFHFFYADDDGNHLYHINVPSGIMALDPTAFYYNPLPYDISDFVLPADLTAIEAEAFSGTDARFVWLPEGITSIGSNAFADSQVKYVYIPYDCNSIGEGAFPAGTIILGDFNSDWNAGYAKTWAVQNGCSFILLEAPFSGNG